MVTPPLTVAPPSVDLIYPCDKIRLETQIPLDAALPLHATDAVVFEPYGELARRPQT